MRAAGSHHKCGSDLPCGKRIAAEPLNSLVRSAVAHHGECGLARHRRNGLRCVPVRRTRVRQGNLHVTSQDRYGAPSHAPQEAETGIDRFVHGFVNYRSTVVDVLETADDCPGAALPNLHAGCLWMFLERPEAPQKARPYLERARAATHRHERESALLAMLEAWSVWNLRVAADRAEAIVERWPQDLATLKIAQYLRFALGDAAGMLRIAQRGRDANASRAPFHSMLAFGHEQCHHIDAAERAASRALELDATEPWAHHALSHVYLTRGEIGTGRRFLSEVSSTWADLNSFMFTHNWWHLALFELAEGRVEQARAIYDERCWGVEPDYSQDQIGAVSLLARLECAGLDAGDRWQALRPYLETRGDDVIQPFLALQYLYGLARADSPVADILMRRIEQQPQAPDVPHDAVLWREVGQPAAEGLLAHARGDWDTAAERLASVQTRFWRIGGSHAQRDLFDQLLLDALLRAERWQAAQQMLELRRPFEPESPLLQARLDAVHHALGLEARGAA